MDPLTAAIGALIVAFVVVTLGYSSACYVKPFGHCRRCHGTGRLPSRTRLFGRPRWCRRCDGTGLRLRLGRHLFNTLRRLYRDGTR